MTHTRPRDEQPIACTLPTLAAAKQQVEKWHAFEADYALNTERTDGSLTIHYAKVEDSVDRLRDLVTIEKACCAFVDWTIDDTLHDLRLIVTGTPFQLAAINVG
ncbi:MULTISPECIES: hypothetical protein [unclassified Microbacterium]|uniref:hypothetical protein n=1 Tax=unclassified Microbacterium TaxID=2609290 RepID=UPI000C2B833F|nr:MULTISPECIES: hypothetical protein [unclassified Microbacterium]MBN9607154.1 hypothetical protein [Actinomycetales bacterium]